MWFSLIANLLQEDAKAACQPPAAASFPELLAACLPKGYEPTRLLAEAEKRWAEPPGRGDGPPHLINVCGLPGSGKTYELDRLEPRYPGYLRLSFDQVMEAMGGYERDYQADRELAFQRWERPARVVGYYLLSRAVASRRSILFEHGNTPAQHLGLYKIMKNNGYHLEIRWLKSSPELVRPRLAQRARYFPERELENRWLAFRRLLPSYRALAHEFIELEGWRGHEATDCGSAR